MKTTLVPKESSRKVFYAKPADRSWDSIDYILQGHDVTTFRNVGEAKENLNQGWIYDAYVLGGSMIAKGAYVQVYDAIIEDFNKNNLELRTKLNHNDPALKLRQIRGQLLHKISQMTDEDAMIKLFLQVYRNSLKNPEFDFNSKEFFLIPLIFNADLGASGMRRVYREMNINTLPDNMTFLDHGSYKGALMDDHFLLEDKSAPFKKPPIEKFLSYFMEQKEL